MDLAGYARDNGIRYFMVSYTDLFGVMRSKLVPAPAIAQMQKAGAGFAGFSTYLDMSPADADMFAVPDPSSVTPVPWVPGLAWVASDLYMNDAPVEQAPRWVLKRALEAGSAAGYRMKSGVEAEFFVIQPDAAGPADPRDVHAKPCYDQMALLRRYDLITGICDVMQQLGWEPYQNDHEDGNGQFEMNWTYADALVTADRHAFFKFMVKALAERHGLRATFMPKPFAGLTGSGAHTHVSLWSPDGSTNLFEDGAGELGLAPLAYHFIGGVLHGAGALCALSNPTVNSYKRINAPVTRSGATWSPNSITYGGNNRTHMIRIPEAGRFELRLPDGAANPYLLQAGILAAGLDGIASGRDPGRRLDIDMYAEPHKAGPVRRLPLNLLDALRELDGSAVFRRALGASFVDSYVKLKTAEWNAYAGHLTQWELDSTLDC